MNLNVLEVLRRLEGDLISACNYLKGRCQVDEAKHFLVVSSSRARGNGHEQEYHRKFYRSMRKNNWTTLFGGWQNFSDRPIFQKKILPAGKAWESVPPNLWLPLNKYAWFFEKCSYYHSTLGRTNYNAVQQLPSSFFSLFSLFNLHMGESCCRNWFHTFHVC